MAMGLRRVGGALVALAATAAAVGVAPTLARGDTTDPPTTAAGSSQTFTCTGAAQAYHVPGEGVQTLYADVRGGRGAQAEGGAGGYGGGGAWVISEISAVGGDVLTVYVGCPGQGTAGGWGHGVGGDGDHAAADDAANGGGGGGSSAIVGADQEPLVIAGGGGGGGGNNLTQTVRLGGDGGDGSQTGQSGAYGQFGQYNSSGQQGDNEGGCGGCTDSRDGADGRDRQACGGAIRYGGGGGGGGGYAGGQGGSSECYANHPSEPWPEDNAGGGGGGSSFAIFGGATFLTSFTAGKVTISTSPSAVSTYTCASQGGNATLLTVPSEGVDQLTVAAVGGSGATPDSAGSGGDSGEGGLGAVVEATVPVQAGDQFWVQAGCQGVGRDGGSGVVGVGGRGGAGIGADGKNGGGGGGASGIIPQTGFHVADVIAGGGGGGGGAGALGNGGSGSAGGAPTAGPGESSHDNQGGCAPSACGASANGEDGHDAATLADEAGGGGGGGGGWVGGGGGHAADPSGAGEGAGGGAGGDSYVGEDALTATYDTATKPGDGVVVVVMQLSRAAEDLAVHGGGGQATAAGAAFVTPLSVLVTDLGGDPVAGARVEFTLPGSGPSGTFPGGATTAVATSDADGIATAPVITANGSLGSWVAFATLPGTSAEVDFSLTNAVVPTTTHVTVSPPTVTTTEPVTVTVDVTPNQPTGTPPTGDVTVTIQGVAYRYPLVDGRAVVQLGPGDLDLGSSTIQASYPGTRGFGRSTGTAPLDVGHTPTTLALTSSANPSAVGQGVTFTATVSVPAPNVACASCEVHFTADGTSLGTATTDADGVATLGPITTLGAGSRTITATFSAVGGYLASSASLDQQVGTTSIQFGTNQWPANVGTDLVLSAIVVVSAGPDPTGTLTFTEGGRVLCTTPAGPAWQDCDLGDDVSLGSHTYTVTYSGDANHSGSSATITLEVIVTETTTTVSTPQYVPAGQDFDIGVEVARVGMGDAPLSGTVQLALGGNPLGPPLPVAADGSATYRTSIARSGAYQLTAHYSGVSGRYQPSTGSTTVFISD